MQPVLSGRRGLRSSSASSAQLGSRRVTVVGNLEQSLFDLGHDTAELLIQQLADADVEVFLSGRTGDGLDFGVPLEHRKRALNAIVEGLGKPGWFLAWEDGAASGFVALSDARENRRVRRSRSWRVFAAYAWGDRALGESAATQITFWEVGTSEQRELVGTRGQHRFHVDTPTVETVVDGRTYPGLSTFPVGESLDEFIGDIDVVYTWVDGADPDWQKDFRRHLDEVGEGLVESAHDPARFRSRDELRYSLRSVWAYCGWVRNIYIVTAGQVPAWLKEHPRVRIVSHEEILPEGALPTFNSHAIEAAIHRIDGLSEHFVYFNDDMFIARPLRPEVFFTPNGLARVFQGSWRVPGAESHETLAVETAARRGRDLLDERFGRVATYMPLHSPYPLRRSVIEQIELDFPDDIARTMRSKFRSSSDISVAASLAQHYGVALGEGVVGSILTEYAHVESRRLAVSLDRIRFADDVDTFCLNETQDRPGAWEKREDRLAKFFDEMYPVPAPWETVESEQAGTHA